jgi:hypothetical protein
LFFKDWASSTPSKVSKNAEILSVFKPLSIKRVFAAGTRFCNALILLVLSNKEPSNSRYLRKAKARDSDALFDAIGAALDTITPEDIKGWITNCGYSL